jgi:hypothetical protein
MLGDGGQYSRVISAGDAELVSREGRKEKDGNVLSDGWKIAGGVIACQ